MEESRLQGFLLVCIAALLFLGARRFARVAAQVERGMGELRTVLADMEGRRTHERPSQRRRRSRSGMRWAALLADPWFRNTTVQVADGRSGPGADGVVCTKVA